MFELQAPNAKICVRPGNIVKLNRFDDEKWVVNLGWFSYAGNKAMNGWYLVSQSNKDRVKPLNLPDLDDIYVVDIGDVKEDYKELDPEIKKLIHDLKLQVEELEKEVAQLIVEVEAKDEIIAQKGEEILALQKQINELSAEIESLEAQVDLDAETIRTLNTQVTAQAQIIAEKAAEIRALTARVAELAEENQVLTQQHQEDLATIAQQSATIQQQAEAIAQKDSQISTLSEENEALTEENAELVSQHQEDTQTIAQQASQISEDAETISGLNTQVGELETENTRLETQHTADQNTIQYLIDNPPEAHLQPKSVTPTNQMQVVEPDEGYQGLSTVTVGAVVPPRLQTKQVAPSELTTFVTADEGYDSLSSVTVDNVTASIDPNIQPGNIKKDVVVVGVRGTYDPFPYNSVGGIYILAQTDDGAPTKILIKNYNGGNQNFRFYDNGSWLKSNIREVVFENCSDILSLEGSIFSDAYNLNKLELSGIKILSSTMLRNTKITSLIIPSTVDTLLNYCCINNLQLKTLFIPKSVTSMVDNCFLGNLALEFVTIENGFNCNNLNLADSTRYSQETIVSWLEALADRTGETAYTLRIGTTNINKLTAEQRAIATNKNWNLT